MVTGSFYTGTDMFMKQNTKRERERMVGINVWCRTHSLYPIYHNNMVNFSKRNLGCYVENRNSLILLINKINITNLELDAALLH